MTRRSLSARLGLALASVLGMLVLAELTLRRLAPARTAFYELDERTIYRPRPGAAETFRYEHLEGGLTVPFAFNSAGYRGEELKPAGAARRVAVYGDSFVEARLTPLERTFPERLEARLAAATGQPVEAVNAGVSGYGPDQELLRLESELRHLRPALVVVVLFAGNDWGDLVRNALFHLDGQGRLMANRWTLDEETRSGLSGRRGLGGLALVRAVGKAQRMAEERWALPAAAPARGSVERALAECRREYDRALSQPGQVGELFVDHYDADLSLEPASASAAYKRALMRAVLARLGDTAAAARVPLLLVLVPDPADVCERSPRRVDAARFPHYRPSALTDGLEEIARGLGIPVVNLYAPFHEQGGDPLYYPRDGHWNPAGQDQGARLAVDRIQEAGWAR